VGGRGEACTSREHEGNDAHPPPLSIDVLCWSPLCHAHFYSFVLFFAKTGQPQQTMSSRSAVQCVNGMQSPNIRSRCGSDHIPRSGSTVHSEAGFIQLPFVWEEWIIVRELCLQGNT